MLPLLSFRLLIFTIRPPFSPSYTFSQRSSDPMSFIAGVAFNPRSPPAMMGTLICLPSFSCPKKANSSLPPSGSDPPPSTLFVSSVPLSDPWSRPHFFSAFAWREWDATYAERLPLSCFFFSGTPLSKRGSFRRRSRKARLQFYLLPLFRPSASASTTSPP